MLTNAALDSINDMQTTIEGLTDQRADYIDPPTGGTVVDSEARTAIESIIAALAESGKIDPQQM